MNRHAWLLERALNGELSPLEQEEFQRALDHSPELRRTYAAWRRVETALANMPRPEASRSMSEMTRVIHGEVSKGRLLPEFRFSRAWVWGGAAALALALVLGPIVQKSPSSPQTQPILTHGEGSPVVIRIARRPSPLLRTPFGTQKIADPVEIRF